VLEKVSCPHCGRPFTATDKNLDKELRCFFCGCRFRITSVAGDPEALKVEMIAAPKKFEAAPPPPVPAGGARQGLPVPILLGGLVGIVLVALIIAVLGGRSGPRIPLRSRKMPPLQSRARTAEADGRKGRRMSDLTRDGEQTLRPDAEPARHEARVSPFDTRPPSGEDVAALEPTDVIRSPFEPVPQDAVPEGTDSETGIQDEKPGTDSEILPPESRRVDEEDIETPEPAEVVRSPFQTASDETP